MDILVPLMAAPLPDSGKTNWHVRPNHWRNGTLGSARHAETVRCYGLCVRASCEECCVQCSRALTYGFADVVESGCLPAPVPITSMATKVEAPCKSDPFCVQKDETVTMDAVTSSACYNLATNACIVPQTRATGLPRARLVCHIMQKRIQV